jgi:hypothetical protein
MLFRNMHKPVKNLKIFKHLAHNLLGFLKPRGVLTLPEVLLFFTILF